MWQFAEAVRGLADGCLELGIPVTGGNVSFYNQTGATAILPTPVVGVLGVIDDVARAPRWGSPADGDVVLLLGATRDELAGSAWAHEVHGHLGGRPPSSTSGRTAPRRGLLVRRRGQVLTAAHDLSEGGLAQAWSRWRCVAGAGRRSRSTASMPTRSSRCSRSRRPVLVAVAPGDGAAPARPVRPGVAVAAARNRRR